MGTKEQRDAAPVKGYGTKDGLDEQSAPERPYGVTQVEPQPARTVEDVKER